MDFGWGLWIEVGVRVGDLGEKGGKKAGMGEESIQDPPPPKGSPPHGFRSSFRIAADWGFSGEVKDPGAGVSEGSEASGEGDGSVGGVKVRGVVFQGDDDGSGLEVDDEAVPGGWPGMAKDAEAGILELGSASAKDAADGLGWVGVFWGGDFSGVNGEVVLGGVTADHEVCPAEEGVGDSEVVSGLEEKGAVPDSSEAAKEVVLGSSLAGELEVKSEVSDEAAGWGDLHGSAAFGNVEAETAAVSVLLGPEAGGDFAEEGPARGGPLNGWGLVFIFGDKEAGVVAAGDVLDEGLGLGVLHLGIGEDEGNGGAAAAGLDLGEDVEENGGIGSSAVGEAGLPGGLEGPGYDLEGRFHRPWCFSSWFFISIQAVMMEVPTAQDIRPLGESGRISRRISIIKPVETARPTPVAIVFSVFM